MADWIKCSDRLPANAEHVLIATTIWADAHDAIRVADGWMNLSMGVNHLDAEGEVTHWHEKPRSPNAESTDGDPK